MKTAFLIWVTLTSSSSTSQGLETVLLHREATSASTFIACRERAAKVRLEQMVVHEALIRQKGGRVEAECKPLDPLS